MGTRVRRWIALLAGCGALALGLTGLHRSSDGLPGAAGQVYRNSVDRDLPVYAYVYTDVGVDEFLGENGRYGGPHRSGAPDDTTGASSSARGRATAPAVAADSLWPGADQDPPPATTQP